MKTTEEILEAYAAGDLTEEERIELEKRLEKEPELKKELDLYMEAWKLVDYQLFLKRKEQLKNLSIEQEKKLGVKHEESEGLKLDEKKSPLAKGTYRWVWGTMLMAASIILIALIYIGLTQFSKNQPQIQEQLAEVMEKPPSKNFLQKLHSDRTSRDLSSELPESIHNSNNRLGELIVAKDYTEIIELGNQLLRDSTSSNFQAAEMYFLLMMSYYHTQQYNEAKNVLEKIKYPEQYDFEDYFLWYKGRLALKLEQKQEAKEALCSLIRKYNKLEKSNALLLLSENNLSCDN